MSFQQPQRTRKWTAIETPPALVQRSANVVRSALKLRTVHPRALVMQLAALQRSVRLLNVYFSKWLSFRQISVIRRAQLHRISRIHRRANIELARRSLRSLFLFRSVRLRCRVASQLGEARRLRLMRKYFFSLWQYSLLRQRRRRAVNALRCIRRQCALSHQRCSFRRWENFMKRRQCLRLKCEQLAEKCACNVRRVFFRRWSRSRSRWQYGMHQLQLNVRVASLALRYLRWFNFSCSAKQLRCIEQRNFMILLRFYFRRYLRWRKRLRELHRVSTAHHTLLLQRSFSSWTTFLARSIKSTQLEQRAFAVLLKQYWARWRSALC